MIKLLTYIHIYIIYIIRAMHLFLLVIDVLKNFNVLTKPKMRNYDGYRERRTTGELTGGKLRSGLLWDAVESCSNFYENG